jgi:hypothetical protein
LPNRYSRTKPVQDKRPPPVRQAADYISATAAAAQVAIALDMSERDARRYLSAKIRVGQLAMSARPLLPDGIFEIRRIEGGQNVWLTLDSDGRVYLQVRGITRRDFAVVFLREDIDRLCSSLPKPLGPPQVEPKKPKRAKPSPVVDHFKEMLCKAFPPNGRAPAHLTYKQIGQHLKENFGLSPVPSDRSIGRAVNALGRQKG